MTPSLKNRVTQGLGLLAGGEVARQATQLFLGILLARLLSPSDYGLLGMAMFVVGFLQAVASFGGPEALIQRGHASDEDWSSVFWFGIILSVGVAAVAWIVAPIAATYFREPAITPIVRLTGWVGLLRALGVTQVAWLSKQMRFRLIASLEWLGIVFAGLVGIAMARSGWGVWSLVAYTLVSPAVTGALYLLACPWRPDARLSPTSLRMVLRFGMSLQGQVAINYISRRLDDAIVGRYAGASALGQYSRAYQLMLYPVQNIAGVMGRVMFPALAEIGTDLPRFRSAYLRAISGIALVAFPAMLGLLVTAQEVVPVVYGRQWQPAVPILQVLCFVGLIQSIATTVGWIYMARGATGLMFKWAAFATTVVCCAFLIGIRWGALGVAISYALAMAVLVIPGFAVPFRLISLPVRSLLGATRSAIVGATLMATAVCAIRFALERAGYGPTAILVVCVMSGTLVYLVWLAIERPEPVKGFLSAFSERLRAADSPPRSER